MSLLDSPEYAWLKLAIENKTIVICTKHSEWTGVGIDEIRDHLAIPQTHSLKNSGISLSDSSHNRMKMELISYMTSDAVIRYLGQQTRKRNNPLNDSIQREPDLPGTPKEIAEVVIDKFQRICAKGKLSIEHESWTRDPDEFSDYRMD